MSWEEVLKMPPSVNDYVKFAEEAFGTKSTPPFKGSRYRQKSGWMDKLNSFEDTNTFLSILDDIYDFDKRDIYAFLEKPYKWQGEYEAFKTALDLMGNFENIEGLDDSNFAEWFVKNYDEHANGWDDLISDLRKLKGD